MLAEGLIRAILEYEGSPARFEKFVNELVGKLEGGVPIMSTSVSWDLGRDGKGLGREPVFVCATLTDQLDAKVKKDLKRISAVGVFPKRLYYATNQPLSEKGIQDFERSIGEYLPDGADVKVLDRDYIVQLVQSSLSIFESHYPAELAEAVSVLKQTDDAQEAQVVPGLRLALCTCGHSTSTDIREAAYRASLLLVLSDNKVRTANECSKDLADLLHLGQSIPEDIIGYHLDLLHIDGLVSRERGLAKITEKGHQLSEEKKLDAATALLAGRQKIRSAIETALGQKLLEEHFDEVWKTLRSHLANLFYTKGAEMVDALRQMLPKDKKALVGEIGIEKPFFVDDLAGAVANTSHHHQQRDELRTAIRDMFSIQSGPASEWLGEICAAFVTVCSLGLEARSGEALSHALARMSLVLDTDVVLSLLCEGEPNHRTTLDVVKRWRRVGGSVRTADPVLREATYHAWIAQTDFDEVRTWLPGTEEDRAHYIDNAFVRAFASLIVRKKANVAHWKQWISQFRGKNETDSSNIESQLHQDFQVEKLLSRSAKEADLERRVLEFLVAKIDPKKQGRDLHIAREKARRDASLYASMVRHLQSLRRDDAEATCFLVSSARRLADVEKKFHVADEPHFVVTLGMVAYILTLVPQVKIGLPALGTILFDHPVLRFSSAAERTALRLIRESDEYTLPWAKRTTLMREFRKSLLQDARQAGTRGQKKDIARDSEKAAFTEKNKPRTVELIRDSLQALGLDSRDEREFAQLRQELDAARKENELLKRRIASTTRQGSSK